MNPLDKSPLYMTSGLPPSIDDFISNQSESIQKVLSKKHLLSHKWDRTINERFDLTDESLFKLCLYLDVCQFYYDSLSKLNSPFFVYKGDGSEMAHVFSKLEKDISSKSIERSRVIGKSFNYKTGCLEYELEDGNYVKIENDKLIPPKMEIDDSIFPDEFIKIINISKYREMQINKINDK